MPLLNCVAFMLIVDRRVLVEQRKPTKKVDPGCIAIPGGHVEKRESLKEALHREMDEELGIVPGTTRYICSLLHGSQEFQRIHYFAVESWQGIITNREADSLFFIGFNEIERIDVLSDRIALRKYVSVYCGKKL